MSKSWKSGHSQFVLILPQSLFHFTSQVLKPSTCVYSSLTSGTITPLISLKCVTKEDWCGGGGTLTVWAHVIVQFLMPFIALKAKDLTLAFSEIECGFFWFSIQHNWIIGINSTHSIGKVKVNWMVFWQLGKGQGLIFEHVHKVLYIHALYGSIIIKMI